MASLKLIVVSAVTFSLLVNSTPAFSVGIPGNATNVATKVAMKKPSPPEVIAIESSATYVKKKKSYVNITVTVTHPASNPTVTSKVVSGGGKSCTIKATKTTCILKQVPLNKSLIVKAKAKNKKGFSKFGLGVVHIAGGAKHPTVAAPASIVQTPASTSPQSPTPTPAPTDPIPTCATGATCALGDTGPGGGLVYYVSSAGFNCGMNYSATGSPTGGKCHYLEVAPNNWSSLSSRTNIWLSSNDPDLVTPPSGIEVTLNGSDESTLGIGRKNSLAIRDASNVNQGSAAESAMSYAGGGKSDWYLPSVSELNALCHYSRNTIVPVSSDLDCTYYQGQDSVFEESSFGFIFGCYRMWSSSVSEAVAATDSNSGYSGVYPWVIDFYFASLLSGYLGTDRSDGVNCIRPIRAF
jgi:hypothetical protein